MKLHFDDKLPYQLDAIHAVCDLFRGQDTFRSEFTVIRPTYREDSGDLFVDQTLSETTPQIGYGNSLRLPPEALKENLRRVQARNGLGATGGDTADFTVEMETGTGKTYVYLRTIFELNRRYGFTKFIIVVPSVAIKEGVYKTLEITREHFRSLYAGTTCNYFVYDSNRISRLRDFATSSNIEIMIMTVGSINKRAVNVLYQDHEAMGGVRPLDLILQAKPIMIVDEPQSVDGGKNGAGREAINEMKPLCTLRYSATHVDEHAMVYRLNAVDAYERKLVKRIEVASAHVRDQYNTPFVRVERISSTKVDGLSATLELYVRKKNGGASPTSVKVRDGDDLEQTTNNALYADHSVGTLSVENGQRTMLLKTGGDEHLMVPGQRYAEGIGEAELHRQMIRRTIHAHLNKEKDLEELVQRTGRPRVKVLSLFFIDRVANYRVYDESGEPQLGPYAKVFEEEYERARKLPEYASLFVHEHLSVDASRVHDGYFSIDPKGRSVETTSNGENAAGASAFNLIMKDKERLLSFATPLKFIFSHSALKEGWDNPNVFQICNFSATNTERWYRQTIGRGLRLCVDETGQRIHDSEINRLTVISTESYERFAENLQKEYEKDAGLKFGFIEQSRLPFISYIDEALLEVGADLESARVFLGEENAEDLWKHLRESKYIDAKGKVREELREALASETLSIPEAMNAFRLAITTELARSTRKIEIEDADRPREQVHLKSEILQSPEFQALWKRIKKRTLYRVQLSHDETSAMIGACERQLIERQGEIRTPSLVWRSAELEMSPAGVGTKDDSISPATHFNNHEIPLPDILGELQNRTQLTRASLVKIVRSTIETFQKNPQAYIQLAGDIINRQKREALMNGLRYDRVEDILPGSAFKDAFEYSQDILHEGEARALETKLLKNTRKSLYNHVIWDSNIERQFAEELEKSDVVELYTKLPSRFVVRTPLGNYNPDWAIVVNQEGQKTVYLVVETKGTKVQNDLPFIQDKKIDCGNKHFEAIHDGEAQIVFKAPIVEFSDLGY